MVSRCFVHLQLALDIQHTTNRSDTRDDAVHLSRKNWTTQSDGPMIHNDINCARMRTDAAKFGADPPFQYNIKGMISTQESQALRRYASSTIDKIATCYVSRIS